MTRAATTCLLALSLLAMGGAVDLALAHEKLAGDGRVHRVHSQTAAPGPLPVGGGGGTALVHTIQLPNGVTTSSVVPGTDTFSINLDPVVEIDPVTDEPVLVWCRNIGSGCFDSQPIRGCD